MSDQHTVKRFSNAQVVLADQGLVTCDVITQGGKITGLGAYDAQKHNPSGARVEEIDLTGLVMMPGVIDPHLHLGHGKDIARPRVPEDAAQESAAAAVGGITTFIPYLMSSEPFETQFDDVCAVTQAGSRIDFG
jgi:dihydroorotase-like cyclic amidohydrolase